MSKKDISMLHSDRTTLQDSARELHSDSTVDFVDNHVIHSKLSEDKKELFAFMQSILGKIDDEERSIPNE